MHPTVEQFFTVLKDWAEENELTDFDENDTGALLDELEEAGITVLPKKSITELRAAAVEKYQWPAPLGYPTNTPAAECEHYYCLTERFPNEGVLLMWGDGENKPEWCEWDGDAYEPTTHNVLAFWPMPSASAAALYRAATPPAPVATGGAGEALTTELEALALLLAVRPAAYEAVREAAKTHEGVYMSSPLATRLISIMDAAKVAVAAALLATPAAPEAAPLGGSRWAPEAEERQRPGIRVRKGLYPNSDYQSGWATQRVVWNGIAWVHADFVQTVMVDVRYVLVEAEVPAFPALPTAPAHAAQ